MNVSRLASVTLTGGRCLCGPRGPHIEERVQERVQLSAVCRGLRTRTGLEPCVTFASGPFILVTICFLMLVPLCSLEKYLRSTAHMSGSILTLFPVF